jgi:5-methylcytosine-specific restriction endonuclease McrA
MDGAGVARIIAALERVSAGLVAMARTPTRDTWVPTQILREHAASVAAQARELRGLSGAVPERRSIPAAVRQAVLAAAYDDAVGAFRCACCGAVVGRDALDLGHIVPVARGGSNARENLRVECRSCNRRRGAAL